MNRIKKILMTRDKMTEEEAESLIFDAKEELNRLLELGDTIRAYDICYDQFGLEPDYLDDLL